MDLLALDPGMMVWTWAAFFVLLIVLYKTALKPMLSAIDEREKTIAESLEKAENAKKEAESLLAQHQELIRNAETEAKSILKENRELAEKSRTKMIQEAQEEVQKIRDKATSEINAEKESALAQLRTEVVDLAIEAAKKVIGESLVDEKKQRDLVSDYVKKLPESLN